MGMNALQGRSYRSKVDLGRIDLSLKNMFSTIAVQSDHLA
jgi:hypothetical protein